MWLLCAFAALEGADKQLIYATMKHTHAEADCQLVSAITASAAQAIMTSLAVPFWGILADRGVIRQTDLLMLTCVGQGLATIWLATLPHFALAPYLCGVKGVCLAGLRAITNSMIAKTTSTYQLGKVFSRIQAAQVAGSALCTLTVVPSADFWCGPVQCWRAEWGVVGFLYVVLAALTGLCLKEPPANRVKLEGGLLATIKEDIKHCFSLLNIASIRIMICQGVFGTIPWAVMPFMLRYYQIGTMSDWNISLVVAARRFFSIPGSLLAGWFSDVLAVRFGVHGRPLLAQMTVAFGMPLMYLNFCGIPAGDESFWIFFFVNAVFGLVGNWAEVGCNWPVLSQIVPREELSRVMAVEGAIENALAHLVGSVALAAITEKLHGFTTPATEAPFGTALGIITCVSWLVCFIIYSLLHWSVPRDLKRLVSQRALDNAVEPEPPVCELTRQECV